MINRRSALKTAAMALAGSLVKMPDLQMLAAPACPGFGRVVFDERFETSRVFAAEFCNAGVLTSAIRGDVAKLWYDDLRISLGKHRAPIAGLTDRAALFCMEELMRDVTMRVVCRVDHILDPNGRAYHSAIGPESIVAAGPQLPTEAGLGRAMALLFSHFDVAEPRDSAAQKVTGPFSPENKIVLVSWVIA
jgi:hypothetical protein